MKRIFLVLFLLFLFNSCVVRVELVTNGGFEQYQDIQDDKKMDRFFGWASYASAPTFNPNSHWWATDYSKTEATATAREGVNAVKLYRGRMSGENVKITQHIVVEPGRKYVLVFYTRGDGEHGGNFSVSDGVSDIIPTTPTGVTSLGYSPISVKFMATTSLVIVSLMANEEDVSTVYFDDVSLSLKWF